MKNIKQTVWFFTVLMIVSVFAFGFTHLAYAVNVGTMTTYAGTGTGPYGIAFDGTNMWTANTGGNSVTKITPEGVMTTYTGTGAYPIGIAFDGTNMWTANHNGNSVTKITPGGAMTTYTGTGAYPIGIAFDGTNMWVTVYDNSVTKITPEGAMTTYTGTGASPRGIAFDGTNMWTANWYGDSVTKITPEGAMTTYTAGAYPSSIAFDGTNMWTTNNGDNSVTKITPEGAMTTYTGTGTSPYGLAFDGTNMWTTNNGDNSVTKITPEGAMTTYTAGAYPIGIAFDGINMWTANYDGNSVTKIVAISVTDSSLHSLTISEGTLDPVFDADTFSYTTTVTYGIGSIDVTAITNTDGATITGINGTPTTNGVPVNVVLSVGDNTITILITAEDDSTSTYTIVVTRAAATKDITAFIVPNQLGDTTINGTNISITMPSGTDVTALAPIIVHNGVSISPDAGIAQDFTNPVTYTVTAEDSTTQDYIVTVTFSSWIISYDTPDISITSFAFDTANHVIYADGAPGGGPGGTTKVYRCETSTNCDAEEDWTVALNQTIVSLYFGSVNNVIYAGSLVPGSATIYRCETSTGCDADEDWTVSYATSDISITSFTIDTANQILYAGATGGAPATLYRCAISTGCNAEEDWTIALEQEIQSLTFDSTNNVIYAGSLVPGSATIYRCETSTGCDADEDWTVSYATSDISITSFTIDTANQILYAGATGGAPATLYRCAISTGCNAEEDWTIALEQRIDSLVFDSTNNVIYAGDEVGGFGNGIIYSCETSTGCDADEDWTIDFNSGGSNTYTALGIADGVLYAGSNPDGIIYRKEIPAPESEPEPEHRSSSSGGRSVNVPPPSTTPAVIPGCDNRTTGFSVASGVSCALNLGNGNQNENQGSGSHGPYNFGTTTLRNGSWGEAVKELQRFLNAELNLDLVIDGILGPKTIAAIKQWQQNHGLVVDGLVGPLTKAMMNSGQ